jgi:hypothetical protein
MDYKSFRNEHNQDPNFSQHNADSEKLLAALSYSTKAERNISRPYYLDTTTPNLKELFLHARNKNYVVKKITYEHRTRDNKFCVNGIARAVYPWMEKWAAEPGKIQSHEHYQKVHWIEVLDFINNKFIKEHDPMINSIDPHKPAYFGDDYRNGKRNAKVDFNVQRIVSQVGVKNEKSNTLEYKKYEDMTADDMRTLDVYRDWKVEVSNDDYRYNNSFPVWRTSVQKRHFARDSADQGLRDWDWRESSKPVPIRKYDMSAILATTDRLGSKMNTVDRDGAGENIDNSLTRGPDWTYM